MCPRWSSIQIRRVILGPFYATFCPWLQDYKPTPGFGEIIDENQKKNRAQNAALTNFSLVRKRG